MCLSIPWFICFCAAWKEVFTVPRSLLSFICKIHKPMFTEGTANPSYRAKLLHLFRFHSQLSGYLMLMSIF